MADRTSVCIVTGSSRGIGAATARLAASQGFAVAVNYLQSADAARAVVREIEVAGGRAVPLQADISDPDEIERLFDETTQQLGPPTALVNNAVESGGRTPVTELAAANVRRILDVGLVGPILCIAEAARRMSRQKGGAGGAIVNVSSQAARTGGNQLTPYVAAKAGLEAITTGLARELGPQGIRVNAVCPGVIATGQQPLSDPAWLERATSAIPLGRLGTPEEAAAAIVWLISSESSYVNGACIAVTGGR